jgi:hypothetical protein
MIWWVPVGQHRHAELHLTGIQLLYGNAYVLLAAAALLVAASHALLSRRSAPAHSAAPMVC